MNHHIPNYLGVCKIKNQMLWGLPQSQPPKLNHVLTISWAAQTTTLANNPRLEHIKSWIRTFPAHFMCWRRWTYVICVCTLSDGQMYFQQKTCVLHFGRALTQNYWICHIISNLWMVGLVMRLFFPVGPTFGDHPHVFSQKRSSPLEFIFDTCASASSSHLFWLVKLNICGCSLLLGQMYVQPKIMCFAFWARVDTKLLNLSHHVLSMDGWPGDATFFLLGQPLKIISMYSAKKGPAPWNWFLTPAPRPLQVTFFGWWSWTYVVAAFF